MRFESKNVKWMEFVFQEHFEELRFSFLLGEYEFCCTIRKEKYGEECDSKILCYRYPDFRGMKKFSSLKELFEFISVQNITARL